MTVVSSPLVTLMTDQVQGIERAGRSLAVTINGMLSMPGLREALVLLDGVPQMILKGIQASDVDISDFTVEVDPNTVFPE